MELLDGRGWLLKWLVIVDGTMTATAANESPLTRQRKGSLISHIAYICYIFSSPVLDTSLIHFGCTGETVELTCHCDILFTGRGEIF